MAEPTFRTVPILRIFDVAKAKEFYVGFLGLQVDWEHRFEPDAPVYIATVDPPTFMTVARAGNKDLNSPLSQTYDFFSPHLTACYFLFVDGSVRSLPAGLNVEVLRALCTRDGGEPIKGDDF